MTTTTGTYRDAALDARLFREAAIDGLKVAVNEWRAADQAIAVHLSPLTKNYTSERQRQLEHDLAVRTLLLHAAAENMLRHARTA